MFLVFNLLWTQLEASRSRTLWKRVCHSRLKAFLSWCRDDVPSDCRNFGSMIPFPFAVSPFSTTLFPLFFVCVIFMCGAVHGWCRANQQQNGPNKKVNFREKEKQILDKILGPTHYDRRIRPSAVNGTGLPSIRFFFFSFLPIRVCVINSVYSCRCRRSHHRRHQPHVSWHLRHQRQQNGKYGTHHSLQVAIYLVCLCIVCESEPQLLFIYRNLYNSRHCSILVCI